MGEAFRSSLKTRARNNEIDTLFHQLQIENSELQGLYAQTLEKLTRLEERIQEMESVRGPPSS